MTRKLPERVRVESNHRARFRRASLYSFELLTLRCEIGVVPYPREIGQARTGTYPDHNRALYPVKLLPPHLPVMPFANVQRSQMELVEVYDGIPALGLGPVEGYVCPRDQPTDVVTRFPPAQVPALKVRSVSSPSGSTTGLSRRSSAMCSSTHFVGCPSCVFHMPTTN